MACQGRDDGKADGSTYIVDGIVASPDRSGVGGLRASIVDKHAGGTSRDVQLAETVTDDRGPHKISITFQSRTMPQEATRPAGSRLCWGLRFSTRI